jgi:hypothetical protein
MDKEKKDRVTSMLRQLLAQMECCTNPSCVVCERSRTAITSLAEDLDIDANNIMPSFLAPKH